MPLKLTELDFRRQVVSLAAIMGYEHVGFRVAQTTQGWRTPVTGSLGKGWPDLVLVNPRKGRILFVELKAEKGIVSEHQSRVMEVLRLAGAEVYVWRPSDLDGLTDLLNTDHRKPHVEYGVPLPPK